MNTEIDTSRFSGALKRALAHKVQYAAIGQLLTDGALERALRKEPLAWEVDGPLTLVACLASEADEFWPPIPTLRAVNENLAMMLEAGAVRRPGQLMKKLLDTQQFLNAISELALARTLADQGWSLRLEEQLSSEHRADADIVATRGNERIFVDVTNLGPRSFGTGVRSGMISEIDERALIVQKLITKHREKFEVPLAHGWSGPAWVAIDVAKNHEESVHALLQATLRSSAWYEELRGHVRQGCPDLAGFVVYSHPDPGSARVSILAWIKLQRHD